MSFLQEVSNWLLGSYKVRTSQLTDKSLIQHVTLVDQSGNSALSGQVSTTTNEGTGNVTTGSAQLLGVNTSRLGGYISNLSDTVIYVSFGGTASATKTPITPGSFIPLGMLGVVCYTGAITGIHFDSGNKAFSYVEFTA